MPNIYETIRHVSIILSKQKKDGATHSYSLTHDFCDTAFHTYGTKSGASNFTISP